jgi:Mg-chelatase subunit ChlD
MKSKLLISSLFVVTAGVVAGYPLARSQRPPPPAAKPFVAVKPAAKPKVDVVFVLDTTGSMSGLIDAAKENIWSIATTMASAQPAPELRMGLVAFRDRGDEYVTRVVDLSSDLDSMYATLMDFRADGGGDTPESVNQALHDAVHKVSWSQDRDAYQVIFLVGDAPPHMDYQDDVKYPDTIKAAIGKGIVVNTILAGGDSTTETEWKRIAQLNQGEFLQVAQSGSAVSVSTPFDEQIAALSKALDDTRLYFGDAKMRAELERKDAAADKLHAGGSYASRAKRAEFNASEAGRKNLLGDNELVDAVESGRLDLDTIDEAQLPAGFRELGKDQQAQVIKETAARRAALNAQIATLSEQRRGYIATEVTSRDGAKDSLDQKLFDTVKAQAAEKGLHYDAAAPAL